jgi:ribosome biogenesis GTPase
VTDILASLGWSDHFAYQLAPGDLPARVTDVSRSHLDALGPEGALRLRAPGGPGAFAVGDWVAHDGTGDGAAARRLGPLTEIARLGVGGGRQLIAANVEALGVVTSCNADFNVARLERYVALALGAGCEPLVVLTKADQADPAPFLAQARALSRLVTALALDAREGADPLLPWVSPGLTLALVGSSGVGKTTLRNALTGEEAATAAIREDDARGRHTTTGRSLRPALAGGWLVDTPGMRELGLVDVEGGLAELFADIGDLAARCRFRDCAHEGEPGCAVQAAVARGELDADRLARSRKLGREERVNTEALHERRAKARAFGRLVKDGKARGKGKRGGP